MYSPYIYPFYLMRDDEAKETDENSECVDYYDNFMRQPMEDVDRIMSLFDSRYGYLYKELEKNGVKTALTRYTFRFIVYYTLKTAPSIKATQSAKINLIYDSLMKDNPWIFAIFRSYGIPVLKISMIVKSVISLTLNNMPSPK